MRVLVTSRKAVPGAVRVEPLSNDALYAVFELNDVNISKEEMDALIGAVNAHTLTVDVTGTWYNRLVFDAGQQESARKTWTISGPAAGSPMHDSGLLGPVVIVY
jgi:hypothetical protein